ncbi:threonine-phosphate decarboxylase CobD [Oceanibium sediminis]|uniref:threonine-phosphate decarboxylase CobD n=1 Tax=Oceanibium sediminis TaxID=2026339 RepID=UPI000DD3BA27|nr:threonine-phosphate decarboxylase CobD [Oceanibium sediminis]
MRDHGGNIDAAMARFGGQRGDWLDLSTGINRRAYAVPDLPPEPWRALPTKAEQAALLTAARRAYGIDAPGIALAGAQAAIGLIPRLRAAGLARVLSPTYNEHAAALHAAGWTVETPEDAAALNGADIAVVVNPNNPDGRHWSADALRDIANTVGLLVVDESFADMTPEHTVAPADNILVLRSFGKFFGLAGLRLGFVFGAQELIAALEGMAGPWPVSGPALAIGTAALTDLDWQAAMRDQLQADALRLDALAAATGWTVLGGTALFRLLDVGDSRAAQDALAKHHVWSRVFPYAPTWLRLGLPGAEAEWVQLENALQGLRA